MTTKKTAKKATKKSAVKKTVKKATAALTKAAEKQKVGNRVGEMLMDLVTNIPDPKRSPVADPDVQAKKIANASAIKAATVSGTLAIPPGPIALLTIIPDLKIIYSIQTQMVSDIAAVYGKQASLNKSTMIFCLFKHATGQLLRDLVVRVGTQYVAKQATRRIIQQLLKKAGLQITQRIIGRSLARILPVVGAVGIGAYAFYDTSKVAQTTIDLFSRKVIASKDTFTLPEANDV
jgi:uncharacterized protein (DUF697 family)